MAILLQDDFNSLGGSSSINGRAAPTGGTWAVTNGGVVSQDTLAGAIRGSGPGIATNSVTQPAAARNTTTHVYMGTPIGPTNDGPGVCFDGAGNGYSAAWRFDVGALRIYKWVNGAVGTTLASITSGLPAAPSVVSTSFDLTIQRDSNGTLRVYINGTEYGSVVDNSYTTGKFAVVADSSGSNNGCPITAVTGEDGLSSSTPMGLGSLSVTATASGAVSTSTWAAQAARPTADVSAGTWTASAGGALYAAIDETTPDDADYISYTATGTCRVRFGALSDPGSDPNPVRVSYRIAGDGSAGQTVKLYSSTTLIATWTHTPAPATATTYTQTLTSGQRAAITNWSLLELEVTGT